MSVTGSNAKYLFVLSSIESPYTCNAVYITTTTWLQSANYSIQQLSIHPCLFTRVPRSQPQPHSHSCDVPIVYATGAMDPADTHQHSCYIEFRNHLPNNFNLKYDQSKVMTGPRRKCPCLCMCGGMYIVSPRRLNEKYNDQHLNCFMIKAKKKECRCNRDSKNAHGRKIHGHKTRCEVLPHVMERDTQFLSGI